jgi:hypothetical protein
MSTGGFEILLMTEIEAVAREIEAQFVTADDPQTRIF